MKLIEIALTIVTGATSTGTSTTVVASHARTSGLALEELTAGELDLAPRPQRMGDVLLVRAFAAQHTNRREGRRVVRFTCAPRPHASFSARATSTAADDADGGARGRAGAVTLLGAAVTEGGLRGFGRLRLWTPHDHVRARARYEREGWTPTYPESNGRSQAEHRRVTRTQSSEQAMLVIG